MERGNGKKKRRNPRIEPLQAKGVLVVCFEYFVNLHMLVDEWNQELHFALIIGILLAEFNK